MGHTHCAIELYDLGETVFAHNFKHLYTMNRFPVIAAAIAMSLLGIVAIALAFHIGSPNGAEQSRQGAPPPGPVANVLVEPGTMEEVAPVEPNTPEAVAPDSRPHTDYYASIDADFASDELRAALHDLIDDHTELNYRQLWEALAYTDEDPSRPGHVVLLYTARVLDADHHGNERDMWNREHVWAKSRGDFGTQPGAGTGLHMIRQSLKICNSRSSLAVAFSTFAPSSASESPPEPGTADSHSLSAALCSPITARYTSFCPPL